MIEEKIMIVWCENCVCDLTFPFNNKLRTLFYLYEDIFKNLNESFCTRKKNRREIITRHMENCVFI